MAPVTATKTGIPRQTIDDPQLKALLSRLSEYAIHDTIFASSDNSGTASDNKDDEQSRVDVEGLVGELERWPRWRFQEMADLYEWIVPLNVMDAALRQIMEEYPALLLIGPLKKKRRNIVTDNENENDKKQQSKALQEFETGPQAESETDANSIPPSIIHAVSTILRFLSTLLRHAFHKSLFNSVKELSNLLAAADDGIAALALEVISNLAAPPYAHRLQSQETTMHTTALLSVSNTVVHSRLIMLAKGWGTRGCGLDLSTCVATDDSSSGQGKLPRFAGEVVYDFLPASSSKSITVKLSTEEIIVSNRVDGDSTSMSTSTPDRQNEKRRKTSGGGIGLSGPASRQTKSTAFLFFQCIDQIGGRSKIAPEKLFEVLTRVRLAASFHSQALRIGAVQRRLNALMAALHAHPSQDVLAGYFHAQPELCTEIGDLVRPIVSSSAISATGVSRKKASNFKVDTDSEQERRQAAIASIVDPATASNVPYEIRTVAVEVLTALVSRKDDGSSAGLSSVARQTNVLGELGVGKGQFSGLLPTLIRYSLASLNAFLSKRCDVEGRVVNSTGLHERDETWGDSSFDIDELGLDLGLTFLEATKSPSTDRIGIEAKALEFVEIVLSLAASIVSVTTGTASLTDCGLVPALVSTIGLTSQVANGKVQLPFDDENISEKLYCSSLLSFITSQSTQILENAIITHNPALIAFHDLKAVDLLVSLLHSEYQNVVESTDIDTVMKEEACRNCHIQSHSGKLDGSTRALLFSILNCLTIVFHHQETNPRSTNAPVTPADVLRTPEMTKVLAGIMENVFFWGGVLGALATTLLSDIMNSDPKVVHYVYESSLADTFFRMIKGKQFEAWDEKSKPVGILDAQSDVWHNPQIPPSAELIMSLPNIVIALALTEDGRKRVLHVNPIPELLSLMCTAKFSMPHSRCMLNDMASIIGTGLDELMRHVPDSKSSVIKSLVAMIERVVYLGQQIVESEVDGSKSMDTNQDYDDSRVCLMHYASNVGQALEHLLQNEENCGPFVDSGGVEAILKLHSLLVVRGIQLLSHVSCQSSPSVANLSHSTAATNLMTAIKRSAVNDDPSKVIKTVIKALERQLDEKLVKASAALREASAKSPMLLDDFVGDKRNDLNLSGILEAVPRLPLNRIEEDSNSGVLIAFSNLLLEIINTEWLSQVLSEVIRVSCQRTSMPEMRSVDRNARLDWQKHFASESFKYILERLGLLYRTTLFEVCRVRSFPNHEEEEIKRCSSPGESIYHPASYKLRIVCSDGAVIRDGIDIDSCDSVGNLEMGEEVEAFDRCINRSGIMRYLTTCGWVSEQTRGHGREPISEVIHVSGVASVRKSELIDEPKKRKPVDFGIPDLCNAGASILARLQNSQCSLYTSLSRLIMVASRMRMLSLDQTPIASHIGCLVREVGKSLRSNFEIVQRLDEDGLSILGNCGMVMFLGNVLSAFHSCLYEERRDKQFLNVLILFNILYFDGLQDSFFLSLDEIQNSGESNLKELPVTGFYGAVRSIIKHGLSSVRENLQQQQTFKGQRLNRAVASSIPAALSLIRRLSSQNISIDQHVNNTLQKMKASDFVMFVHDASTGDNFDVDGKIFSFRNDSFARSLHSQLAQLALELWTNPDLKYCPPHLLNPIFSLVQDVLVCVQESTKKSAISNEGETYIRSRIRNALVSNFSSEPSQAIHEDSPSSDLKDDETEVLLDKDIIKEMPESEGKKHLQTRHDLKLLKLNKELYASLKENLFTVGLDIIEHVSHVGSCRNNHPGTTKEVLLEESEACTSVTSSFILDLCSRYPEERSNVLEKTFHRLISMMDVSPKGSHAKVEKGKDQEFASVCHAAVLFLRALPRTRISALENNLVSLLVHCLRTVTSKIRSTSFASLPSWVSPVLLFLDVMAQPLALPEKSGQKKAVKSTETTTKTNRRDDYDKVVSEHKKQRTALSKTAKRISFALAHKAKDGNQNSEVDTLTAFSECHTFAPLINQETADHILSICMQLLRPQKRQKNYQGNAIAHMPPECAHATMLLLTKILYFHKVASRCLRMGGVDFLLALHPSSRFKGHVSLITLALRRMMEDDATLQISMEIEVRSILTKLLKKQSDGDGVSVKAFLKIATRLICRDPVVFLKAAASSICVKSKSSSTNEDSKLEIHLLAAEERSRRTKIIHDCFRSSANPNPNTTQADNSHKTPTKSQTKLNPTPSSKKKYCSVEKGQKGKQMRVTLNGKPSNHITTQLLTEVIRVFQNHKDRSFQQKGIPFLCIFEYLEILGDLLLVVPACSFAICNYRLPGSLCKKKSNSQSGLHYLLHSFLPQPREVSNPSLNDQKKDVSINHLSKGARENYLKVKIAQCSARLLVALVARAGEGRRKVISELSSALRGDIKSTDTGIDKDQLMWSLQAWGELCLGLAAPRKTSTVTEDSSLSFQVVKVMLEYRMAYSLMNAIKKIDLNHPLAASAAANLLKPLEIHTRPSVLDTLHEMFEKDEKKKKLALDRSGSEVSKTRIKASSSLVLPSHPEGNIDDGLLADGFDAESNAAESGDIIMEDDYDSTSSEEGNESIDEDGIMMSESEDESTSGSEISDSDSNSDDNSTMVDDEIEVDHMEIVDDGEGDMSNSDSEVESDDEEDDDVMQMDFEDAYDDDFQAQQEEQDDFLDADDGGEEDESGGEEEEEGWTSIDSTGLGGMLFPSRNAAPPVGRPRQGGLMIEAAASVLNNILRSGEIQMEAIAEIEQSLGIRIPPLRASANSDHRRFRIRAMPALDENRERGNSTASDSANLTSENQGPIGATPLILQSNPPDNGFTSIGNIGRTGDTNFMEYFFGGPVFGPSRIYYDFHLSEMDGDDGRDEQDQQLLSIPSSVDVQLFPGGPAACTQTSLPLSPHILLAGVSLPPLNSLISRNRRIDEQTVTRSRRTNDPFGAGWPDMLANSRGNVIRINRSPMIAVNGSRVSGNVDDSGQSLENIAASEFSQAFERALGTFVSTQEQERNETLHGEMTGTQNIASPGSSNPANTDVVGDSNIDRSPEVLAAIESNRNDQDRGENNAEASGPPDSNISSQNVESTAHIGNTNSSEMQVDSEADGADNTEAEAREDRTESVSPDRVAQPGPEPAETDIEEGVVSAEGTTHTEETPQTSEIEVGQEENVENHQDSSADASGQDDNSEVIDSLTCPTGMDPEVFAQLPREMQQEIIQQHQPMASVPVELDESSGLDPEALAALPEDMRREVIEQERNERRLRQQQQEQAAPADPSRAEDIDSASFIASLAPDLREEILMTADDDFLNSLPPDLLAEAQLLRERAMLSGHRHEMEPAPTHRNARHGGRQPNANDQSGATARRGGQARRRIKTKIRVDCNRTAVTFVPPQDVENLGPLVNPLSMKSLIDLMFLLSPVRPQKLLQKLFQNLCFQPDIRKAIAISFIALLNDESQYAVHVINSLEGEDVAPATQFSSCLIGTPPELSLDPPENRPFFRRSRGSAATAIAMNLPLSANGSMLNESIPPVVARRIIGTMLFLTKNASRFSLDILNNFEADDKSRITCLDTMLSLLAKPKYSLSSSNLEDILNVLESICSPLSSIPLSSNGEVEPSKKEMDAAASAGKEFVAVPRAVVSPNMLKLLCSILRLESCKDSLFARISNIARRLCRVQSNRQCVLEELATVAHGLGSDAVQDLRSLRIRLDNAVHVHYNQLLTKDGDQDKVPNELGEPIESVSSFPGTINGTPSSAVTLSTSAVTLKLLRVLQTLHSLCVESTGEHVKKYDGIQKASKELVDILRRIKLDSLWHELEECLRTVSVLEGVTKLDQCNEDEEDDEDEGNGGSTEGGKKLQNSVAGLLTSFLPTIEAFFVVNTCVTDSDDKITVDCEEEKAEKFVGGERLFQFIAANKVLLNALLRSSPSLLDKGLRAMVYIPKCRSFLDFDVKRHWFKQQVRKLRSQASRRHGSLRLTIRRQYVFEDAYRQLNLRSADELRGRLHITFASEEGVDAGGLSREFFGILAKEMFNPNYALFTSTEDGCTFQPNPHSSINREHLDYFRFVGRVVGKAVADGFLLDAHFTRSLYKHMLGIKPTYHDMQAIDPDFYRNLKMILDYKLEDIGLDLNFSTTTNWFGRSKIVDLIPNGRNIIVTEDDKEKYVSLVCQHRMTTAIEQQIKAYLDGFYDLVKPELISIFTPKELELLISGMPDIDIVDLKKNTEYHGYRAADKEIVWFWNIMFSLTKSEKAAFLQFVTGSSKVPLQGFSDLQGMRGTQKFSIHKANGSVGALISAHTCFNSLDLPLYMSEDEMKEKLLYAIKEGAGSFQFS